MAKKRSSGRSPSPRRTAFHMDAGEFRDLGYAMIDEIADYFESLSDVAVTRASSPTEVRRALGQSALPETGTEAHLVFKRLMPILREHSLFTAHPRFWGYITGSTVPAGVLADLLASSINPNVGAWQLSPVASEIELQSIRWIAQLIGYPETTGGIMVSGGNMANFVCFLAARTAKAEWDIRSNGMRTSDKQLTVYVSQETHTWIQKAADLFGLGVSNIRWIPTDQKLRMDIDALKERIARDKIEGFHPFLVVGAGGTVGTGAVDALPAIASLCEQEDMWFHVDGAYGAPAAASDLAPDDLRGLSLADSVALDPHKWLYAPLEAGCALVRDPEHLRASFSFRPEYYRFEGTDGEERTNMFEYGMQNSRGFRALKVWVQLQQAGRKGIIEAIDGDIRLAQRMAELLEEQDECEVWTTELSITTFRYVPSDLWSDTAAHARYLNELNEAIVDRIQKEGTVFVSNAVIRGSFLLRACIVNVRTTEDDVNMLPGLVVALGKEIDSAMRKEYGS